MAPAYITDLINVREHAHYSLLSNLGTVPFHPAGKKKKSVGERSLSVGPPTLWNVFQASLHGVDSILTFKF